MKKSLVTLAIATAFAAPSFAGTFTNGGFEDGNLNGWTGAGGCWGGGSFFGWSCGLQANMVPLPGNPAPVNPASFVDGPNNTIMSGGNDPITGASRVYNGNYSVRVNDSINNYGVSIIRQSITNYTDNDIFFQWNAVLEASHGLFDSDHFLLVLRDDTTSTNLVSRSYSSAGSIGSGTTGVTWTQFGSWFSSGWVTEHIDLAALGAVGHDFTLTLLAADCPYGGHAGYVYLDGFAPIIIPPGAPEPATLALMGLGLGGLAMFRRRKAV